MHMDHDEIKHLSRVKNEYVRRLRELEIQKARFGDRCPAEIVMEVEDLESKINQIDDKISQNDKNKPLATSSNAKVASSKSDREGQGVQSMQDNGKPHGVSWVVGIITTIIAGVIVGVILYPIEYWSGLFQPRVVSEDANISGSPALVGTPVRAEELQTFSGRLGMNEIIVGHAEEFQDKRRCVAFLIVGPSQYNFIMKNGIYYRHENVESDIHDQYIQEQSGLLISHGCPRGEIQKVVIDR